LWTASGPLWTKRRQTDAADFDGAESDFGAGFESDEDDDEDDDDFGEALLESDFDSDFDSDVESDFEAPPDSDDPDAARLSVR
jgi:hypothetical protein